MRNIDEYIDIVKKGNIDGGDKRTKAYRFEEDGVVLIRKSEDKFYELKEKIDLCKKQGINIAAYYDYKKTENGECYILEELAKGTEFASLINDNPDALKIVSEIPYNHIEKYIRDSFLLEINGVGAEPRRRNIFYDNEIGFTIIDVLSMKEKMTIENMDIDEVYYFFLTYAHIIPNCYKNNDYEKSVSDKIKSYLIEAFEKGHPLFKKYERWIFRNDEDFVDFVSKNGVDLTLNSDEIKYFKDCINECIEDEVTNHINDVYFQHENFFNQKIRVLSKSIEFCSKSELLGDDNISLEKFISNSVNQKLEVKQRQMFPEIFENRDRCYKILELSASTIPDERIKEINGGHVLAFFETLTEKYGSGKIPTEDVMNYYDNICLIFKKVKYLREKSNNNLVFGKEMKKIFDMIDADELVNNINRKNINEQDIDTKEKSNFKL